jgi:hypothetical protein
MVFYIFSLLGAFPLFPRTCVIWQLSMKSWVAYRLVSNFAIPTRHTHNITYMHTFRPPMLIRLQTHYIYEMYSHIWVLLDVTSTNNNSKCLFQIVYILTWHISRLGHSTFSSNIHHAPFLCNNSHLTTKF